MQPAPSFPKDDRADSDRAAPSDDTLSQKAKIQDSLMAMFLGRRGYFFMAVPLAALFAIYYYILEPSNFASFSDTLRYFISALSTLLAVVVSFNTLALRNQLNNMPTNTRRLNEQLENIDDLLQPLLRDSQNNRRNGWTNSSIVYADALEAMLLTVRRQLEFDTRMTQDMGGKARSRQRAYADFVQQIDGRMDLYAKYRNPFYLVSVSTTAFVQRMKFTLAEGGHSNQRGKALFETAKRLHLMRNIGVKIFIRNVLTELSFDLLVFTIPIITFAAVISAISNYGAYDSLYLRLLFAASMSTVALPFALLFIRTLPVLQLIKSTSSIPFETDSQG